MLTFAEDVTLLVLDDETGAMLPISELVLNQVLAGAVLMDLAYRSKIDVDEDKITVADSAPTGEAILDPYLSRLTESAEIKDAQQWIQELAADGDEIREQALAALVEKGILKVEDKKILWVFGTRRYPAIDSTEEREVKMRIIDVVLSDSEPEPRDVVLICLVNAAGLFNTILSDRELGYDENRIQQVCSKDPLGQALSRSVTQLQTEIAVAMASAP